MADLAATVGLVGVAAFGLWMMAIGSVCATRPARALIYLSRMASSHRINLTEQSLRMAAGVAFILRAPTSHFPAFFAVAGWFVVVTSVLLLVLPLRWHAGYSIWWSQRIPKAAVKVVGIISILAGPAIFLAAL